MIVFKSDGFLLVTGCDGSFQKVPIYTYIQTVKKNPSKPVTTQTRHRSSGVSFTDWLLKHQRRRSPLGDLARDVASDRTWPRDYDTDVDSLRAYLSRVGACAGALETLTQAWRSYRAAERRTKCTA
jgi:uncharacterized protein YozE (UPF0346 family)